MYYSGRGVPRDSGRAAELFRPAAGQNEPTAQLFLALMHFKSDGVPSNAPLALMWVELAMAGGQSGAFEWHGIIMQSMTTAERDEGWRWRSGPQAIGSEGASFVRDLENSLRGLENSLRSNQNSQ
jgi:TPR repeat protein